MANKKIHKEHIENFCFDNPNKFKIFPNIYKKNTMVLKLILP